MTTLQKIRVPHSALELAFVDEGDKSHAAVMMTHSNERIDMAIAANSCAPLAAPTTERWFTSAFLSANPNVATVFPALIAGTSVDGFVGTARAIQGLDYLPRAGQISVPTTLIVGSNDGPLVGALRGVSNVIKGSRYELIEGAGHLSNIDQPEAFNVALLKHFAAFQ